MTNGSDVILKVAEEAGDDYDRVKLLEIGAEEQERWDKKKKKMNPDPGFSGKIVLYCIMRPYTDATIGPLSYRHSSGVVRNPHSALAE